MSRIRPLPLSLALLAGLAACGADPALLQARSTLASATRVITDLDARVASGPAGFGPDVASRAAEPARVSHWDALRAAVAAAGRRAEEAALALDLWEGGDAGDLAWRTVLPCLGQELAEVRGQLQALGVPLTISFDEALARTESSGERCGSRRPPAEH